MKSPFTTTVRPGTRTIPWVHQSHDLLDRALDLLNKIEDAQYSGDIGLAQSLAAELTSMPGYPRHQPGDRIEMEVRTPVIVLPN